MVRFLCAIFALALALIMGEGLVFADTPHARPAPISASAPRLVAQAVNPTCSFNVALAKSLGIGVCGYEPRMVADTVPGTPGSPSPQVITVQGCTGCISTGSGGGGGGGSPYTGVAAGSYGQTGTAGSFVGVSGFDYLNGNVDNLTVAPFGGNGGGTGYPASYGQPGVLVVQGGLQGGAIGIAGNLGGPYGTAANQTATTNSGFLMEVFDGTHVQPALGTSGGAMLVAGSVTVSGPVTMAGSTTTVAQDTNNGLTIGGEVQPSAAPTAAAYVPVTTYQNASGYAVPQAADTTAPVVVATAAAALLAAPIAQQVIAGVSGKQIYVSGWNIGAAGGSTGAAFVGWVYGSTTTTPCDNGGTTPGSYTFLYGGYSSANSRLEGWTIYNISFGQAGWTYGSGLGTVFAVPAGANLCIIYANSTASQALNLGGILTYTQH